jgi:hypothetical protein
MTPKEKAIEIVDKFKLDPIKPLCIMHYEHSKQCALIAVDEILNSRPQITDSQIEYNNYWQEVKTEIQKL